MDNLYDVVSLFAVLTLIWWQFAMKVYFNDVEESKEGYTPSTPSKKDEEDSIS